MHNRIRLGGAHPADLLDIKAISCSFVRRPFPVLGTEYPCSKYYLLVITVSIKIRPQRSVFSSDRSGTFPLFASQFSWPTPVKIDRSANRATLNVSDHLNPYFFERSPDGILAHWPFFLRSVASCVEDIRCKCLEQDC